MVIYIIFIFTDKNLVTMARQVSGMIFNEKLKYKKTYTKILHTKLTMKRMENTFFAARNHQMRKNLQRITLNLRTLHTVWILFKNSSVSNIPWIVVVVHTSHIHSWRILLYQQQPFFNEQIQRQSAKSNKWK